MYPSKVLLRIHQEFTKLYFQLTDEGDDRLNDGEGDGPVERLLVVYVPDPAVAVEVVQVEDGGRGDARYEGPNPWEINQGGF